jgi:hypothetical protein
VKRSTLGRLLPGSPLSAASQGKRGRERLANGTSGPRAQPFTNTRKRQPSGVTTLHPVAAYPRRSATPLSPSSLYLITRVPGRGSYLWAPW